MELAAQCPGKSAVVGIAKAHHQIWRECDVPKNDDTLQHCFPKLGLRTVAVALARSNSNPATTTDPRRFQQAVMNGVPLVEGAAILVLARLGVVGIILVGGGRLGGARGALVGITLPTMHTSATL